MVILTQHQYGRRGLGGAGALVVVGVAVEAGGGRGFTGTPGNKF